MDWELASQNSFEISSMEKVGLRGTGNFEKKRDREFFMSQNREENKGKPGPLKKFLLKIPKNKRPNILNTSTPPQTQKELSGPGLGFAQL